MDFYKFIIQLSSGEIPFLTFISEYFDFYNLDIITIKNNINIIQKIHKTKDFTNKKCRETL